MNFPFESLAVIHKVRTFASAFEGQALVERKFFDRLAQVRDGAPRVPPSFGVGVVASQAQP